MNIARTIAAIGANSLQLLWAGSAIAAAGVLLVGASKCRRRLATQDSK